MVLCHPCWSSCPTPRRLCGSLSCIVCNLFSRFFEWNDIECTWRQAIRKESCWTISNITAGNREQIQEAACSAWLHGSFRCLDRLVRESIILKREVYNMQPSPFGLAVMPEDCGNFSPSIFRSSTTVCCLQILGRNSASVICALQFGYCMLLMLMASQVHFFWGHPFASDCRFWHQERGALSLSKRYWLTLFEVLLKFNLNNEIRTHPSTSFVAGCMGDQQCDIRRISSTGQRDSVIAMGRGKNRCCKGRWTG